MIAGIAVIGRTTPSRNEAGLSRPDKLMMVTASGEDQSRRSRAIKAISAIFKAPLASRIAALYRECLRHPNCYHA